MHDYVKFHRRSLRRKNCDYREGVYFVTLLTKNRKHVFGEIAGNSVILTAAGEAARKLWLEIPLHHKHAVVREFVVMPDHFHAILELTGIAVTSQKLQFHAYQRTVAGSLGTIVRGYKGAVTRYCRETLGINQVWHRDFYERKILESVTLAQVIKYIEKNPQKWNG